MINFGEQERTQQSCKTQQHLLLWPLLQAQSLAKSTPSSWVISAPASVLVPTHPHPSCKSSTDKMYSYTSFLPQEGGRQPFRNLGLQPARVACLE